MKKWEGYGAGVVAVLTGCQNRETRASQLKAERQYGAAGLWERADFRENWEARAVHFGLLLRPGTGRARALRAPVVGTSWPGQRRQYGAERLGVRAEFE